MIEEETGKAEDALAALLGHLSLRLRVGAFQAAALHLLPPALTALRHRHHYADVSVIDIVSGRGIDEVADGRLDLAVIASWGIPLDPPPQVRVHSLLYDPMVVVLPDDHPLITESPNENPVSRLALTGVPGTDHRELTKPRPHRQLHAVTAADTTLTPLVDTFLDLLHDVAGDVPRPTTRQHQRYGGE